MGKGFKTMICRCFWYLSPNQREPVGGGRYENIPCMAWRHEVYAQGKGVARNYLLRRGQRIKNGHQLLPPPRQGVQVDVLNVDMSTLSTRRREPKTNVDVASTFFS